MVDVRLDTLPQHLHWRRSVVASYASNVVSQALCTLCQIGMTEPVTVREATDDSWRTHEVWSNGPWRGSRFMPLTRGEAVGYDADLMAFGFTMKNGQQIVQCQISRAALVDLVGRSTGGAGRDLPAQFEAHRELIEAIASAEFDRISNEETRLVRIFAKHIPSNPTQK